MINSDGPENGFHDQLKPLFIFVYNKNTGHAVHTCLQVISLNPRVL